jgi:uncharacterized protein (TIGR03437 family)
MITTVAGNGVAGISGDGGQATEAEINIPMGIALDTSGNLFIADQINARIRRVTPDGTISTVAGSGTSGFAGDGSTATNAQLYSPCGVAVDRSGNLYIADSHNHRIRKVTAGGVISTVAGTGVAGFSGDGGAATSALLNTPTAVAIDSAGSLYIADALNSVIRKLASDGTISTVAGIGVPGFTGDGGAATSAALNQPIGITFNSAGDLFIADTYNHRIRKVSGGVITTVAGGGGRGYVEGDLTAIGASLNYPEGVSVDAAGNLYIADSVNNRIRLVRADGTITTIAGSGSFGAHGDGGLALNAQLNFPHDVLADGTGKIYVADNQNSRIRLLTPAAASSSPAISPSGVTTAAAFGGFRTIARGSWIEIFGTNLAVKAREWAAADFDGPNAPASLEGTRVSIGGIPAFPSYVSPTQLNVQVSAETGLGTQSVVVTTPDGQSNAYTVLVRQAQPGLLAPQAFRIGERQYAVAVLADGVTRVMAAGAVAGVTSRPARPGETITMYGTGLGAVTPYIAAGEVVQRANALASPLQVFFGSTPATVTYAGLAPGTVGLYQISVIVPDVAANDAVPLTFTLGGVPGEQMLFTAVGN